MWDNFPTDFYMIRPVSATRDLPPAGYENDYNCKALDLAKRLVFKQPVPSLREDKQYFHYVTSAMLLL